MKFIGLSLWKPINFIELVLWNLLDFHHRISVNMLPAQIHKCKKLQLRAMATKLKLSLFCLLWQTRRRVAWWQNYIFWRSERLVFSSPPSPNHRYLGWQRAQRTSLWAHPHNHQTWFITTVVQRYNFQSSPHSLSFILLQINVRYISSTNQYNGSTSLSTYNPHRFTKCKSSQHREVSRSGEFLLSVVWFTTMRSVCMVTEMLIHYISWLKKCS